MLKNEFISIVRNYTYQNSEKDDIHGFLHVERVFNLCLQIGRELGANLLVLKIAALLHDIGRSNKNNTSLNKNHAEVSADMASKFLISKDFKLSKNDYDNIIHSIKTHSFSNNITPETLEAKTATGFSFDDATATAMLEAVERALEYYRQPAIWQQLVCTGMKQDFSWKHSAQLYIALYETVLEERSGGTIARTA